MAPFKARINLALLVCDTPIDTVQKSHGNYLQIFTTLLQRSIPEDLSTPKDEVIELHNFDVMNGEYPKEEDVYDGIMLTGSAKTAYKTEENPWIVRLVDYVRDVATRKPQMKIIGICFGHQIIAMALGGTCVNNNKTWEVGPTAVKLNDLGKKIFGIDREELHIQQFHQDIVPTVPTSPYPFQLLGSTDICLNQGMVLFDEPPSTNGTSGIEPTPLSTTPGNPSKTVLRSIRIFSTQGHPEFHWEIMSKLIEARSKNGVLSPDVAKDAAARNKEEKEGVSDEKWKGAWGNDGVVIGRIILEILGI